MTQDMIQEWLEQQDWPAGALYVIATPIGNLMDLTWRAWYGFSKMDVIAAEDTRVTGRLLSSYHIRVPLMASHQHNEAQMAQTILKRLEQGQRVGLVSDAGAPCISDPGAKVVQAVLDAGYRVIPLPGASALMAAMMSTGEDCVQDSRFFFAGFIPAKKNAKLTFLKELAYQPYSVFMYEAPHRILDTARAFLEVFPKDQEVVIGRELTKRFEQIQKLTVGTFEAWLTEDPHRAQGEFVIRLKPFLRSTMVVDAKVMLTLKSCLNYLSLRDAVKLCSEITEVPKDVLYRQALDLKKGCSMNEKDE